MHRINLINKIDTLKNKSFPILYFIAYYNLYFFNYLLFFILDCLNIYLLDEDLQKNYLLHLMKNLAINLKILPMNFKLLNFPVFIQR